MNYHKKILSSGFKRCPVTLIDDSYVYSTYGDAYKIIGIEEFIKTIKPNNGKYSIRYLNASLSLYQLKKVLSYKYELSNDYILYISTYGLSYFCFAKDFKKQPESEVFPRIKFEADIIKYGRLSDSFWMKILDSLPIVYKRQIILNGLTN